MRYLYAFFLFSLLCVWPNAATAAQTTSEIIISEINWAGSTASIADEWIELYNPNGEDVDIGGWILTGSATGGEAILIADDVVIEAESTLLVANYDLESEKTTLVNSPDLTTSSLSLSNSSFEILLTTPDGLVIDEATLLAGSSTPSVSQERDLTTLEWRDTEISMNLTDELQMGTPGWVDEEEEEAGPLPSTPEDPEQEPEQEPEPETLPEEEPLTSPCTPAPAEPVDPEPIEEAEEPVEIKEPDVEEEPATGGTPEPEDLEEPEEVIVLSFLPNDIMINEIVSDPTEGDEWIELFNPGESIVDLNAWTIEDRAGRDTILQGVILPGSYVVIQDPNGALNNDGDDVILKDPNGQIIHSVSYDDSPPIKGESYAVDSNDEWMITTILTPGQENLFPEVEELVTEPETSPEPEAKIEVEETSEPAPTEEPVEEKVHTIVAVAAAPELAKEQVTKVSATASKKVDENQTIIGVVTALPETFGRQVAFIEGVQLYFYHANWPELSLGDVLSVTGEASSNRGEPRLKIASTEDIVILSHSNLSEEEVEISNIGSDNEGRLVTVHGSMLNREGDKMTFHDDSGEILIVSHVNSGIRWTDYDGVDLAITGVVRVIEGEPRIYPRSKEDVQDSPAGEVFSEQDENVPIAASTKQKPWLGLGLVALSGGSLAYWYVRERKRQKLLSFSHATK